MDAGVAQHAHFERPDYEPGPACQINTCRMTAWWQVDERKTFLYIWVEYRFARFVLMPVDEDEGPLLAALGLSLQHHQRVVPVAQQSLRALLIQRRYRLLHRVDLGDEAAEIEAFGLGLVCAGGDHVERS